GEHDVGLADGALRRGRDAEQAQRILEHTHRGSDGGALRVGRRRELEADDVVARRVQFHRQVLALDGDGEVPHAVNVRRQLANVKDSGREHPMKLHLLTTGASLALLTGVGFAIAQAAAPPAAAPAAPAAPAASAPKTTVESLMATAKVAAGTEWGNVVMAVCIAPTPTAATVAPATVTLAPAPTAPVATAPASPPKETWYAPPAKV